MNDMTFLHPDNIRIDRDQVTEYAIVTDNSGKPVYNFPATWTDEQIQLALAVANLFYVQGVQDGRLDLMPKIQRVLDTAI
jgi:hypothetical protein